MRRGVRPVLGLIAVAAAAPAHGAPSVLLRSGDAAADGEPIAAFARPVLAGGGRAVFVGSNGALLLADGGRLTVVARTGDPLPAPLAGTFNAFAGSSINAAGAVAFRATLNSPLAGEGVFLLRDGALATVALGGAPAGDPEGVGDPQLNDALQVAWGSARSIRLWSAAAGTSERLVGVGDPAPGGGIFRQLGWSLALGAEGRVAFVARVRSGADGVFAVSAGAPAVRHASARSLRRGRAAVAANGRGQIAFADHRGRTIVRLDPGAPAPVTLVDSRTRVAGGPLRPFRPASLGLDGEGRVTFVGRVGLPGPPGDHLIRASAAAAHLLARGRPAFGVSAAGRIAWTADGELFAHDGTPVRLVGRGDPTPIGAGVVATAPAVNDAGAVAFTATREALYALEGGTVRAVLRAGDVVPGAGTVAGIGPHAADRGRLACLAVLGDGSRVLLAGEPGALVPVVASGGAAPGGGTHVLEVPALALAGERLVFAGTVAAEDGSEATALFRANLRTGRLRRLPLRGRARRGASVPSGGLSARPPRVALAASTPRDEEVLLLAGGGGAARVAWTGRRAPGTGGRLRYVEAVAVGGRAVLLAASVEGGRASGGVFLWRRGVLRPVIVEGDAVPEGRVGTLGLGSEALALDGRRAAFVVPVLAGGVERAQLLVATRRKRIALARAGEASAAGGTLAGFGGPGSVAVRGETVLYVGALSGAGAAAALFACSDLRCD